MKLVYYLEKILSCLKSGEIWFLLFFEFSISFVFSRHINIAIIHSYLFWEIWSFNVFITGIWFDRCSFKFTLVFYRFRLYIANDLVSIHSLIMINSFPGVLQWFCWYKIIELVSICLLIIMNFFSGVFFGLWLYIANGLVSIYSFIIKNSILGVL